MKFGVTSSIVFHAFAVGLGLVSLSSPKPLNVADVEALPVDIVPIESIIVEADTDPQARPKSILRKEKSDVTEVCGRKSVRFNYNDSITHF